MIAIIDTQANAWQFVFDPKSIASASCESFHCDISQRNKVRVSLSFQGTFSAGLTFTEQHYANLLLSRIYDPSKEEKGLFKLCLGTGDCIVHIYEGEYEP